MLLTTLPEPCQSDYRRLAKLRSSNERGIRQGLLGVPLAAGERTRHRASGDRRQPVPCARDQRDLTRGTALDAGCGEGAEAIWLASEGWQVTAADISGQVLARATQRAAASSDATDRIEWVEADLSVWQPRQQFDLVTTHYAHPAMPQLEFYERISHWVAPRGTLLVVGHLHRAETHGHDHDPPVKASVTAAGISAALDPALWDIVTAEEHSRTLGDSAEGWTPDSRRRGARYPSHLTQGRSSSNC